jgi:D-tagatose-1,6-bisphosphate aldolase subunit GatZ/KbaZ
MFLDEIVAAQKRGEARGIPSICSAHPSILKETLTVSETLRVFPLIEATCNQVNQFGGYTGMRPGDFVAYVRGLAEENNFPFKNILLGGDHLGPSVWQNEPSESAMQRSETLVRDYVQAGFTKIHLDCSMRLADDPPGALDVEISACRTARLAKAAEAVSPRQGDRIPRYVIGTEVPIPGGATEHEEGVSVTRVEDARRTIQLTRAAFLKNGLESAWERVAAVVVQPGVEFGDDFVLPYQPEAARGLSQFIESQPQVYEAHSTDYQSPISLKELVRGHFAILKVGPALTFAFREAVFALAGIEQEMIAREPRSNIIQVLEDAMLKHPEHWKGHYRGTEEERAFKRKFSFSDRARYYWVQPEVQSALRRLMRNLGESPLPRQFTGEKDLTAQQLINQKMRSVLEGYYTACMN